MDQVQDQSSPDSGSTPAPEATGASPAEPTWDAYYKEASRRRRAAGGVRNFRVEKRRRRIRERLVMGLSLVLVGAITTAFYMVLR